MKIFIAVIVAILIVILCVYLFLFPPLPLIPEIGRNLSPAFRIAKVEFSNRVGNAFPTGVPEKEVRTTLLRQGFKIHLAKDGKWYAVFEKAGLPCRLYWMISWRSDADGAVKDLSGDYGGWCF